MLPRDLEQRLSDLIAFQCVLVALRGASPDASEEMLWQTFLSALVQQYGFARACYAERAGTGFRPVAAVPVSAPGMEDLPVDLSEDSPLLRTADMVLPVSVDGCAEGTVVLAGGGEPESDRAGQIDILTAEVAAMLADRRARLRHEEQLRRATLQADAANRAKSLLLANMSHEIRTPMTGVIGFTNLLAATQLNSEQQDYVEQIRSSGEALLTLINDILDFSKISAGKLALECRPLDLCKTLEQAVGLLAMQAAEKHLRLTVSIDPSTPPTILGDVVRIRQILVNLLGNAVKFTERGEVSISVSARLAEEGRHVISFVVRDTGPGIPEEHQARIFDSFNQVDASISRKYGGTGLGLSISKSLAEQMGGAMALESEVGVGSTFRFTIRALAVERDSAPPARATGLAEIRTSDIPQMRLMVVDDNAVNRKLLSMTLQRLGIRAALATNGAEALESLSRSAYDVILMDVQMPVMDGLEATRRIRRSYPAGAQPRIVAMTAGAFPEDRAHCLEAGMDDYLSKPVNIDELVETLRRIQPALSA
jgi:signal transduction histidine kinase/CheY-like chemotaxis protein